MLGEFITYYRNKIVGGIYEDRLLVKPVKSVISYLPTALYELLYDGAKEMLLVDEVNNKEFLTGLITSTKNKKEEIDNFKFNVVMTDVNLRCLWQRLF